MLRISLAFFVLTFAPVASAQMDPEAGDVWLPPPEEGQAPQEQPPSGNTVVIDLQVQSTPTGAQVIANRQVIGITPLDTQLPVAAGAPVRVTVQLEGYQPHTFEVDPSRPSHSVQASLVPIGQVAPGDPAQPGGPGVQGSPIVFAPMTYDPRPRYRFGGALGFFTRDNDTPSPITMVTLDLGGMFRLLGNDEERQLTMDLGAEWSFFVIAPGGTDAEARPNNPNLTLYLGSRFGVLRLYGGLGFTLPIAAAIDDNSFGGLTALAGRLIDMAMHGGLEAWSYLPSHIALHGRGGLEVRLDGASFGTEMVLFAFMPGIEANYPTVNNLFGWQLRFFGEGRPIDLLSFGGQLGIAYLKDLEDQFGLDEVFVSLEPFIRLHFDPAYIGLRFLLNFTETAFSNFSFDDAGVWSLTFEAGAELD